MYQIQNHNAYLNVLVCKWFSPDLIKFQMLNNLDRVAINRCCGFRSMVKTDVARGCVRRLKSGQPLLEQYAQGCYMFVCLSFILLVRWVRDIRHMSVQPITFAALLLAQTGWPDRSDVCFREKRSLPHRMQCDEAYVFPRIRDETRGKSEYV